jgi:hypothetical protein
VENQRRFIEQDLIYLETTIKENGEAGLIGKLNHQTWLKVFFQFDSNKIFRSLKKQKKNLKDLLKILS